MQAAEHLVRHWKTPCAASDGTVMAMYRAAPAAIVGSWPAAVQTAGTTQVPEM